MWTFFLIKETCIYEIGFENIVGSSEQICKEVMRRDFGKPKENGRQHVEQLRLLTMCIKPQILYYSYVSNES